MDRITSERRLQIDIIRFLACFFVVVIHTGFPNIIIINLLAGSGILVLIKTAVPLFFIISGYYFVPKKEKIKKQIKKLLKLIGVTYLVYSIFLLHEVFETLSNGNNVKEYLADIFGFQSILKLFAVNTSMLPYTGFMWYLWASIYVVIVVYFIYIFVAKKRPAIIYLLLIVTLLGNLILGEFSGIFLGGFFDKTLYRNFFFTGIPFFLIGILIRRYESKVKKYLSNINCIVCFFVLFVLGLFEEILLYQYYGTQYIDTTMMSSCMAVFIFMSINYKSKIKSKFVKLLAKGGRYHSLNIYLYHTLIYNVILF